MAGSIFRIFDNGEGVQLAVGASGLLLTSHDGGITWVSRNTGVSTDLYGAAFGEAIGSDGFVIVGASGVILTSVDAITWIQRVSFTSEDLYDVAYAGVFLAVGTNGAFGLSDDLGVTWEGKDAGTQEDLVSIVSDLGSYLILGTNDVVITGDISALNFEILVTETVEMSEVLGSNAVFNSAVVENFEMSTEENWLHDALGAGTTLTQGGTNQFIYADETLYLTGELPAPTGAYTETINESVTMIDSMVEEHLSLIWGDITFPMFEVSGSIISGGATSGNLLFPMFSVSGRITGATTGNIIFPMFVVEGIIKPPASFDGNIDFPMFIVQGSIRNVSRNAATDDYAVWVLNAESKHHSTYINWPVNSLGVFNGEPIVASPDGIYRLSGDLDDGEYFSGKIYWAQSDLGDAHQKAIDCLFVRMRGENGSVRLACIVDEKQVRNFPTSMRRTPDGQYVKRVKFPRGLQGSVWKFGIESVGEGKLDLSEIEVITVPFKRRIK